MAPGVSVAELVVAANGKTNSLSHLKTALLFSE